MNEEQLRNQFQAKIAELEETLTWLRSGKGKVLRRGREDVTEQVFASWKNSLGTLREALHHLG
jgi:hypothetical protein